MFIFGSAFETLKKYADFNGRASRDEFWSFFAFVIIIQAVAGFAGMLLRVGPGLSGLVGLLLIIPQVAVAEPVVRYTRVEPYAAWIFETIQQTDDPLE